MVLLHPTPFKFEEDSYGDSPPIKREHPGLGFFAGEYVYLNRHGELLSGAGKGIKGIVRVVMALLRKEDKLAYDYINGKTQSFRSTLVEEEYNSSNCF